MPAVPGWHTRHGVLTWPASDSRIEAATVHDVPLLLSLIGALAEYERMSDAVVATEARLRDSLFGTNPCAEAAIARVER